MKINGTGGVNMQAGAGLTQAQDPESRRIKEQIANVQKQLRELSSNDNMSSEEKMKKRQELQREISDLNMQLRQHEIEQRREAAEKSKQRQESDSAANGWAGDSDKAGGSKAGGQAGGLSTEGMQAMLSADAALGQAKVQGSVAARMNGRAGVLKQEIKLDSGRNGNVEAKKEELAEVEKKALDAESAQAGTLGEANRTLEKAQRAERKTQETEDTEKEDRAGREKENEEKGKEVSEAAGEERTFLGYTPVDIRL